MNTLPTILKIKFLGQNLSSEKLIFKNTCMF